MTGAADNRDLDIVISLKLATSLDGRIALADGRSKWITGPEARAAGWDLRAAADAVVTGIGTVLADDPLLSARGRRAGPPGRDARIVFDSNARLPVESALLRSQAEGPVIVLCAPDAPAARRARLAEAGALIRPIARDAAGLGLCVRTGAILLAREFGWRRFLVEAGGGLAGAFVRAGLVTHLEWFRAPMLLGGDGRACIDALMPADLASAPRFRLLATHALGHDQWERYTL